MIITVFSVWTSNIPLGHCNTSQAWSVLRPQTTFSNIDKKNYHYCIKVDRNEQLFQLLITARSNITTIIYISLQRLEQPPR